MASNFLISRNSDNVDSTQIWDNDGGDVAGKYNEKNAPEVKDSEEQRQMRGSIWQWKKTESMYSSKWWWFQNKGPGAQSKPS